MNVGPALLPLTPPGPVSRAGIPRGLCGPAIHAQPWFPVAWQRERQAGTGFHSDHDIHRSRRRRRRRRGLRSPRGFFSVSREKAFHLRPPPGSSFSPSGRGPRGMEGGGEGESLFSLELLVESARVEPRLLPTPLPASGPFRPAVALCLLDFPTLLVRAPKAAPGPLVPFGRGKSCLFRLRPDALRGLLRRSPLHALLLALPPGPGPARLLGSCSVSLADAAEELLLGAGPGGRRGQFPLLDLMGEPVGELGLSYRLSNLGVCLLAHLGEGAAPVRPHTEEEEEEKEKEKEGAVRNQQLLHNVSPQSKRPLSLELIPEGDEEQDLAPEPFSLGSLSSSDAEPSSNSHTDPSHNSPTEPPSEEVDRELEIEANVFCPPPMYYSCPPDNPHPKPKCTASVIVTVAPAQESFPEEVVAHPTAVPLVKEEPTSRVQEVTIPQTCSSSEQLRQNLSQLPLLNALLVELSLLNSPSLQPQPSSVHPQLAWLYKNAEDTKTPSPCAKHECPCWEEKKNIHRKERGRSASPKLKRNRPDHLKCISPSFQLTCPGKARTKMAYAERIGSPEKNNSKENSPPRRKLTYGLTNTLRLRLQRSNPAMLKVHEKREHHRKKQGELLVEKKGKTTSTKGKLLRGSPDYHPKSSGHFDEKSIPDQKAQINENVETLIQSSVDQNCPTTKKSAAVVKNSDEGKQKDSSEMIDCPYKEKSLKVHLPQVFLQDAEALENKTDMEVGKSVEHKDCDISAIQNDSQSNYLENSHELKSPDDVLANSDNTAYSEDFTNVDSSGPSLESQESSSDPLLLNQDESHSIMDSDSKISGRSLTAQSISPPLPVSSAVSPVQSLKKTYDLKSNAKTTGVVFNKLVDDSPPPGTLEEEVACQHTREEGSKQTAENKEVCSDLNCNIAKGESVEKSSSLRTSQVSSYLPSNVSDLDLSGLEESNTSEKDKEDDFAMLDITNQCRHISELVVNKLPGYTM